MKGKRNYSNNRVTFLLLVMGGVAIGLPHPQRREGINDMLIDRILVQYKVSELKEILGMPDDSQIEDANRWHSPKGSIIVFECFVNNIDENIDFTSRGSRRFQPDELGWKNKYRALLEQINEELSQISDSESISLLSFHIHSISKQIKEILMETR